MTAAAVVAALAAALLIRAERRHRSLADDLEATRRELAALSEAHDMLGRVRVAWTTRTTDKETTS